MTRKRLILASVILALAAGGAPAEVADSSNNGFTVKLTLNLHAAPADVYKKLIHDIGNWWNSEHTFSHDAHNLSIEEKAGGCFCEKIPGGGGVRHMQVEYLSPGKTLVMHGALGPLQSMAAVGSMTITLSAVDSGSKMDISYAVAGYQANGMKSWAAIVDTVLTEQFTRFRSYVDTGSPVAK